MPAAPLPQDEPARLAALLGLDLLDTPSDPVFDRLVRLTRDISAVQTAAISLVDWDRQWFKACVGLDAEQTPRDQAICAYTILSDDVLWIEDASADARFSDNPLVTGEPHIRFYAGAPLQVAGARIGALCIIDPTPRPYHEATARRLRETAALVADALEQKIAHRQLESKLIVELIRQAPVSLAMTDRDLRVICVSTRMEDEYGLGPADLPGRRLLASIPGAETLKDASERALAGEEVSGEGVELTRKDGSTMLCRWEVGPWRDGAGHIGGIRLMTTDVTALLRSTRAVKRSEERLTLALESAGTLVWEFSLGTNRIEVAGALNAFFDRTLAFKGLAADLLAIVHPDDREVIEPQWDAFIAERAPPYRTEHRIDRADGAEVWVLSIAEFFNGPDGRPERIIGSLTDITVEKRNELALAAAQKAAEAANRAKSEFLANMSHELRTPLNGVLGVAGALASGSLTTDQREMVRLIESSATALERLLADVLDLARIESGRLELTADPFDLGSLVEEVAALFAVQARRKGLEFRLALSDEARGCHRGDALRLRQVLTNLASNAVKFTHEGRVLLSVEAETVEPGATRLVFTVEDTGVGFSAAAAERLFDRFEQADNSITRRYGGTGLGLAICRSLVEAMGGTLSANSKPGRGSAFAFTIDLPRAEQAVGTTPARSIAADERSVRVLLAEDHPINRKVVELILQEQPVSLTQTEDGAQALDAFSALGPFDLVLMDMQMPVLDGLSATREIRRHERERGQAPTRIVMLTANALAEHAAAARAAGADDVATKPISAAQLLALVAAARPAPPMELAASA